MMTCLPTFSRRSVSPPRHLSGWHSSPLCSLPKGYRTVGQQMQLEQELTSSIYLASNLKTQASTTPSYRFRDRLVKRKESGGFLPAFKDMQKSANSVPLWARSLPRRRAHNEAHSRTLLEPHPLGRAKESFLLFPDPKERFRAKPFF